MSQATITTSIPIPFNTLYSINLRRQKFSCLHIRENIFALRDHDSSGKLTIKYVIIECIYNEESNDPQYICSCGCDNCLHIIELSTSLIPYTPTNGDELESFEFESLTDTLVGIYCHHKLLLRLKDFRTLNDIIYYVT